MKKRMISLMLMLALCIAMPVAAVDNSSQLNPAVESATYTNTTIFEGIRASDNGQYAISSSDGSEVPVGMLQVDLLDEAQYSSVLNNPDLSDAVKESLSSKRDRALEIGKSTQYAFIFSPRLLDVNAVGTNDIPVGRTEYTWNGHKFMIERVHTLNVDSAFQYVEKGAGAKDKAANIFSAVLAVAGFAPAPVNIVAGGISLLQAFYTAHNLSYVPGAAGDYIQACVKSNIYEQWTWGKHQPTDSDWFLGLYTEKVLVKEIKTHQQYQISSSPNEWKQHDTTVRPNRELKGKNFTDDWQESCRIAWANRMSTLSDPAPTWKVGSKTFSF